MIFIEQRLSEREQKKANTLYLGQNYQPENCALMANDTTVRT